MSRKFVTLSAYQRHKLSYLTRYYLTVIITGMESDISNKIPQILSRHIFRLTEGLRHVTIRRAVSSPKSKHFVMVAAELAQDWQSRI
jgi:hypothetical protein